MSYPQSNKPDQRRAKFLGVFPEFQPVSMAPNSITQVPGYFDCKTPEERTEFEERWLAAEELKSYKALDGAGNVWRVKSPALCRHPWRLVTQNRINYGAKELLGNIDGMLSGQSPKELAWND